MAPALTRAWLFLPSCPHPKLSDAPPQRVLAPCVCHIPCPVPHVLALGAPLLHPPGVSANELLLSWGARPGRRQMETARGTQAGPPRPQSVQWADCARDPGGLPPFPHQGYRLWSPISSSCPLGSHWGRGSGLQAPSQGHSHLALPWVPVCSSMHPCSPAAHQSTEGQGLRGTTQAAVRFSESNAQATWPEGHGKG